MLDFNPRPSMAERINALVDAALIAERLETVGEEHEAARLAALVWLRGFLAR